MRTELSEIKKALDIPEDSWINKIGDLVVDGSYHGSVLEDKIRKATEVDKAVFLLEKTLKEKEINERAEQEKRLYLQLKQKYEPKS